jgi:hypothetical protein
MLDSGRERRRGGVVVVQVLLAVLIPTAIGLGTEAAGEHLPDIDSRMLWTILAVLVLVGIALIFVQNRPQRRRQGRLGERVQDMTALQVEVHTPVDVPGSVLPEQTVYVPRSHDELLADAVQRAAGGTSRLVTLVGDSSTGKTRACHEAVQKLPKGWRLWHPLDPSRPQALLESLAEVRPHTVVWINDAHHYLATDPMVGEQVAAGLRTLLADRRRTPVLILATLWPQFWAQLTAAPADGQPDPHAQTRQLLAGSEVSVPAAFTRVELDAVRSAARTDPRLAVAVAQAEAGRIAQYLAGVPELLRRYRTASADARAVLDAAIDLRRLGHPVHLSGPLLQQIAQGYLSQSDHTALQRQHGEDWFDRAVEDLNRPQRGILGPLVRIPDGTPGMLRLADAIEQAGRIDRAAVFPPAPFWNAITAAITDTRILTTLGSAAKDRGRFARAAHLYQLATARGDTDALRELLWLRARAGDQDGAERQYRQVVDRGDSHPLFDLAWLLEWLGYQGGEEQLHRQSFDRHETDVLEELAQQRGWAWYLDGAEPVLREDVDRGDLDAMRTLALLRYRAGDQDGAERLYREAVDRGDLDGLRSLARLRERVGDQDGAERLYREAVDRGDLDGLRSLARLRERVGDQDGAERLYQFGLTDDGNPADSLTCSQDPNGNGNGSSAS